MEKRYLDERFEGIACQKIGLALALIQDTYLWKGGKEVLLFDERAHMTKRVPHITSDLYASPEDPMEWRPTCHHKAPELMERGQWRRNMW